MSVYHIPAKKYQQQMCPSNATKMPHTHIIWCAFWRKLCQYTSHLWSCSHQCEHHWPASARITILWWRMMMTIIPQPNYICHSHRNWGMKFNLAGCLGMHGISWGASADVQASQHDTTVHASGCFPPKGKGKQSWCHYYDVMTILIM